MPTASDNTGSPLASRLSAVLRRDFLLAILIVTIIAILVALGSEVASRMAALRAAQQDNAQWNFAQLDVEVLALDSAVLRAKTPGDGTLIELRRRFDVYYSRIDTIRRMSIFTEKLAHKESLDRLGFIRSTLDELAPLFDGPDEELQAQLERIDAAVDLMRPLSRQIGIDGVRIYADQSDSRRDEFARLLQRTAVVNGSLILALGTVMLFLVRQTRISRRRTVELELIGNRNANTIASALDAIIAVDMDGIIVEFNPAASKIFGYSRYAAIGSRFDELVVPERYREQHRKDMKRFRETGQTHVLDEGRVEMFALRADGTEFPIELSLGLTPTQKGLLVIAFLRDISQRVEQEKELRAARDEALNASKAKSQFLAIMSHEMRTPLNGIMGVMDLLGATRLTERQKVYVKTATTAAEILKQHVDDLLDLTRIQAGKLEFFPRAFNLVELLEEVANINFAAASARGNTIDLKIDMPQPYFVGDRKRIQQVLSNLVANAIKFTENGHIAMTVVPKNVDADVVTIKFLIRDTGVGISAEHHQRIFEDFITLDSSYQRNTDGAGLGLPISKNIVEAMNGQIGVESEQGKGALFWFCIPLKSASGNDSSLPVTVRHKAKIAAQKQLKVLVVEDNETNRFVAREMLMAANCEVVVAADGREGVKLAEEKKYDLIFMDLSMPNMNGWDAARNIRSRTNALSRDTPIYALTAHALPEEQLALREIGMEGCILKPLRSRALDEVLAAVRASQSTVINLPRGNATANLEVNWTVVEELQGTLGSEVFRIKMRDFIREIDDAVSSLMMFAKAKKKRELADLAHKFAGSSAVFGADFLGKRLRELEHSTRTSGRKSLNDRVNQIAQVAADASTELTRFLESSSQ